MDETTVFDLVNRTSALFDSVVLADFYGPPSTLDDVIAALLVALADEPTAARDAFLGSLTEQRRHVLGRYAMRAPMLAMRTKNQQHLYAGLLAYCLDRRPSDWRDDMVFFALYVHAAQALGADTIALFDRAALHAVPELASTMHTFARRKDVTLGAFGWRQVDTPDGPTFEMLNWGRSPAWSPSGAIVGERSWDEVNQAQARKLLEWVKQQRERQEQERKN